jgi:hypothetical protein
MKKKIENPDRTDHELKPVRPAGQSLQAAVPDSWASHLGDALFVFAVLVMSSYWGALLALHVLNLPQVKDRGR